MLLMLAALWGASFLFIRIGVSELKPVVLIEFRVLIAAIALLIIAAASRQKIEIFHKWWQYLILGAANAAIPFTLISLAELNLSASLAAILNATTPMFTAVVAWLWTKDAFTIKKFFGVILGIVGVGILMGFQMGGGTHVLTSALWSLLAALFYGIAGVFTGQAFKGENPMNMAIGQQLGATIVLIPFAALSFPHHVPSSGVMFSVLGLAILCTAIAYLLFFALIHSVGPVKTLTVTFLVPVFGIIWGYVFLRENVTLSLLFGLVIILSSVALVANVPFRRQEI